MALSACTDQPDGEDFAEVRRSEACADASIPSAIPIIVVAMPRSGGKWLCNMLCNHSEIAGIQHEAHCGLIETNMFDRLPRVVGDIRIAENYVALIETWSQTDFFQVAEADKEIFYTLRPRPADCRAAFEVLMNHVAHRREKPYWLQKISPLTALEVLEDFKSCRIVVLRRETISRLASKLELGRNRGLSRSLVWTILGHVLFEKCLNRICRRHQVVSVRYEQLRQDVQGEMRRICNELGLSFESGMIDVRYRSNTSFKRGARREWSRLNVLKANLIAAVFRMIPLRLLTVCRSFLPDRGYRFVRGTFGNIVRKYGLR